MIRLNAIAPRSKPFTGLIKIDKRDCIGWAAGGTGGLATAQIALSRRVDPRRSEYGSEGASNRTEMTPNTERLVDHLRAR